MFFLIFLNRKNFGKLRSHTVEHRDSRVGKISDMIAGILVVKLYAWEDPFKTQVELDRKKELLYIKKSALLKALNMTVAFTSTTIVSIFPLISFYLLGGVFTPSVIFSSISIVANLQTFLNFYFAFAMMDGSEALISIERIKQFLLLNEIYDNKPISSTVDHELINNEVICQISNNASFKWANNTDETILSDINLEIKQGELLGVCGPVGSGKSSLACAILGEMDCVNGNYFFKKNSCSTENLPLKVAYCSQIPWILSDKNWFNTVLQICELTEDINTFPNGVDTLIGERGVMLSGGQKARVSLARAVYCDADFYVLDDPLSAVDAKVGKKLFENCIRSLLIGPNKGNYGEYRKFPATVVLVTHQLQFLPDCEKVLVMVDGKIESFGTYSEAIENNSKNNEFICSMKEFIKSDQQSSDELKDNLIEEVIDQNTTNNKETESEKTSLVDIEVEKDLSKEIFEIDKNHFDTVFSSTFETNEITDEKIQEGAVTVSTYTNYFKSGVTIYHLFFILFLFCFGQAASMITDWWISVWTNQSAAQQAENGAFNASLYVSLAVFSVFSSIFRSMFFFLVCLKCSKYLFLDMMNKILRSSLNFFEINPHGRILNRFSKDLSTVDEMLPMTVYDYLQSCGFVLGAIILVCLYIPYILVLTPLALFVFLKLRRKYVTSSRQIKRLDSASRSPMYSTVPATLEGIITIRAFGKIDWFKGYFDNLQNENTKCMMAFFSSSRWLGIRLDWVVAGFVLAITMLSIIMRHFNSISAASIGLVLSYTFSMLGTLQWAVRQSAEVENQMIAVERILEYTNLPSEAKEITDLRPPPDWPHEGCVSVNNLSLEYPGSSKVVLKDITVEFEAGQKIAVVGRTGAGKSSLLQAMFRLVEPTAGNFVIDEINLSSIGLKDLRSRISIIPQEPFCFKGTLRFNIDPFGAYSDKEIWNVLELVELKLIVQNMDLKLESKVSEGGNNWSVGERQLICLARAILRNTKLVVMDEATSNVDNHTDSLIQNAIRSQNGLFANSTVITIAHRLNTVIDFDKILVLENGEIVEFGNPYKLLMMEGEGWFKGMVKELGKEAEQNLIEIARKNFEKKK
ncbi:Multidrug resistance-associated protein 4 [Clydaea vesicula]|uniref:Multidrug resistance-associated protein 4 n=1 Tax=Clydaea vesicula TaxID=447962 RepID=A0AAD5U4K2_9FUNG|nr:Multidrug resistance-associated protein 4 [Clydaea vesicula]